MNKYIKSILRSEAGYASFVIALITIVLVSLIVVAFATDARSEQKNTLGNTLATQAYYAAESGVNDAYAVIQTDVKDGQQVASSNTGCNQGPYVNGANSNDISNSGQVQYSCLVVNASPTSLGYQTVNPGEGQTIPITTAAANPINYINVSWEYSGHSVNGSPLTFAGCPSSAAPKNLPNANLPPIASYTAALCGAGVLQIDAISSTTLANEIGISGNPFASQASTVFLIPTSSASSSNTGYNPGGVGVYYTNCTSGGGLYACYQKIAVPSDTTYYLHLQSFYEPNSVQITVQSTISGQDLAVSGAQAVIDSTGSANGQLKRIEERVCDNAFCNSAAPTSAISSTQCVNKQFEVYPGMMPFSPATNPPC